MVSSSIRVGLDHVQQGTHDALFCGKKIALLAHPASITKHFVHAKDVFLSRGFNLVALFGPEHGFYGQAQDMDGIEGSQDENGRPIYSLYGSTYETLKPTAAMLRGVDMVVIDLQDIGTRYYTFIWTAAMMVDVASSLGIPAVILDRPNPLGGKRKEGTPQLPGFESFVGLYPVPVRHAMTLAEVVRQVVPNAKLTVIECTGWKDRDAFYEVHARGESWSPWVLPSPNMPTLDTALVYPGGCLLEATNLSEGRGTTKPFELFGAPYLSWKRLVEIAAMFDPNVYGAKLRVTSFRPTFHKHAHQDCNGFFVHVTDPNLFSPYAFYLKVIALLARESGFAWRDAPYEFVKDIPAIDLLTGSDAYRRNIHNDDALQTWLRTH